MAAVDVGQLRFFRRVHALVVILLQVLVSGFGQLGEPLVDEILFSVEVRLPKTEEVVDGL